MLYVFYAAYKFPDIVAFIKRIYFPSLARGIGGGLIYHKHVYPRRKFARVQSQEPLTFVSLVLFFILVSCVQF